MDLNLLGSDQTKVVGINPKNLIKLVYKVFIPNVFKQVNVHFQGNLELYHYKLHASYYTRVRFYTGLNSWLLAVDPPLIH